MRDSIHQNTNATTESIERLEAASFDVGTVDAVFEDTGFVRVRVAPSNHVRCDVFTPTSGDSWLPTVGETAIVARRRSGRPLLLGTVGGDRTVQSGERIIGHDGSTAHLRFRSDGVIEVVPDGQSTPTVTIDSEGLHFADEQVVTNIETSTDADGHVTSIDVQYTQTISL